MAILLGLLEIALTYLTSDAEVRAAILSAMPFAVLFTFSIAWLPVLTE